MTRGNALTVSMQSCAHCRGLGCVNENKVCRCVWRGVFRVCMARYRRIAQADTGTDAVMRWRHRWELPNQDFAADLLSAARRVLRPVDYRVFRLHHAERLPWRVCSKRTGIGKGRLFHAVYRIEEQLGRAFTRIEPYALYPLDEYFSHERRRRAAKVIEFPAPARVMRAAA